MKKRGRTKTTKIKRSNKKEEELWQLERRQ